MHLECHWKVGSRIILFDLHLKRITLAGREVWGHGEKVGGQLEIYGSCLRDKVVETRIWYYRRIAVLRRKL